MSSREAIIENTEEALDQFSESVGDHGAYVVEISPAYLAQLQNGKVLAVYQDEYSIFIRLDPSRWGARICASCKGKL